VPIFSSLLKKITKPIVGCKLFNQNQPKGNEITNLDYIDGGQICVAQS
jgi:hypothetical protein